MFDLLFQWTRFSNDIEMWQNFANKKTIYQKVSLNVYVQQILLSQISKLFGQIAIYNTLN